MVASLKRRSPAPELQPGSSRRAGRLTLGNFSTLALGRLLDFLDLPAEVSTLEGRVVYANAAYERFTDSHLGEVLGSPALWSGDPVVTEDGLKNVRAGIEYNGTLRDSDGRAHTTLLLPLHNGEGSVAACLTLVRGAGDTRAAERARTSEAVAKETITKAGGEPAHRLGALGQMAGGIAHDFNNMLGVIGRYAELALRRTEPGTAAREAILRINEATQRSSRLTRQLLALSRGADAELELLDLNAVIFGLEELLGTMVGAGVTVHTDLTATPAIVRLPRAQLEQVILNLAANARDAMPNGGKIALRTRNEVLDESSARELGDLDPDDYVVLEVEDTGAGIPEDVAAQVFEPFFTTKERGSGSGLGLSIIQNIIRAAGGHVVLRSEAGQGTTFLVYLPDRGRLSSKKPSRSYQRAIRVLVTDDEAPVRRAIAKLVGGAGFEPLVARDAGEALQLLEHERVHILLTDVVMPGMSGIVLGEIVAERHPEVSIVYMSGYAHDVISERGLDPSLMLYLQKPFTRLELLRKVEKALGMCDYAVAGR